MGSTGPAHSRKYGKQRTDQVSKDQLKAWRSELDELLSITVHKVFNARHSANGGTNRTTTALEDIQKGKGSKSRKM